MQEFLFSSEGLKIHGRLWGAIKPASLAILFCHGAFEFQENWFDYAQALNNAGVATFTFDFAGHGASEGLRNRVDLRVWAYNIRDAMNALQGRGYTRFGIVGWGVGGSAALLAAAHDRRLCWATVLAAPILLMPALSERLAYGLASGFARLRKAVIKKPLTLSRLNELDELVFAEDEQVNLAIREHPTVRENYQAVPIPESLDSVWMDITRAVEKISIPVLIIHGDKDAIIPIQQSWKLYDRLAGPKDLLQLDESGHALHLDRQKEEVLRGIRRWAKKHPNKPEEHPTQGQSLE